MACNQEDTVKRQGYEWPSNLTAPIAEKKAKDLGLHGDSRIDEYYWLNDYFKKGPDSTKVVEYLKAENAYLDTVMSGTKEFQKKLFNEMKGRIKEKDESVPVFRNGYYYYNRFEEGKEYYVHCRKKGSLDAAEEVLLNVNELSKGHDYFSAVGFNVSPDNKLMAYGVDTVSRREYTIYIKNLETGTLYKDAISLTTGGSEWANDNKTLFYSEKNPVTLLSEKIKRHTLGTDASADAVVYHEKDKTNYIGVGKTKSDKYIIIYTGGTLSSENLILDADKPNGSFESFQPRLKEVLYNIDHLGDKFLIMTNKDAKNFKVMETPVDKTGVDNWKDLIPHRTDVLVEGIEVFKDHLVITEREKGLLKLRIQNKKTGEEHYLDFGEPAYTAYAGANPEFNTTTLRYQYTSLTTPNSTFDYNMDSKDKKLMKQQEVVGGYDAKQYVTERFFRCERWS